MATTKKGSNLDDTHATELVLDRPGFSATFDLLDNSSSHVAKLILNSNPTRRITSMGVDGPVFALESATHAQSRARESRKIAALIANFQPNTPVSELIGKSSHDNAPRESQCSENPKLV